jgi:hypothetical protein
MVSSVLMVLVAVLASPSAASTVLHADPSRSVVLGRARFTVLTESMVRMEASKRSTSPTFDGASPPNRHFVMRAAACTTRALTACAAHSLVWLCTSLFVCCGQLAIRGQDQDQGQPWPAVALCQQLCMRSHECSDNIQQACSDLQLAQWQQHSCMQL